MWNQNWRVGEEPAPINFCELLYGDDGDPEGEAGMDEEDSADEEEELRISTSSHIAPIYSSTASPAPRRRSPSTFRSRSPIVSREEHVSVPQPFADGDIMIRTQQDMEGAEGEFYYTPDAHNLFVGEGDRDEIDRSVNVNRERGVRTRVRGGRRGRERGSGNRGRGGGRSRRTQMSTEYFYNHPLEEIWTSDADVPPELINLARDVMRNRQMRAQRNDKRTAKNNEREESESEDDDLFQDATDGSGNPLLEGGARLFEWYPMDTFRGEDEPFRVDRTGPVTSHSTAYDALRSYWDDAILQHIVDETNQYATKISSVSFQNEWYPTNLHEIWCLFAFWMMLGIIRMPTIKSCFSTDPILKTEIFSRIFTQKRYINLVRALQFLDAEPANPNIGDHDASSDLLCSLRPIITHLNVKFQANYNLSKNICIDESVTPSAGKLNFKHCIQTKAAKYGIKTYELCESTTGYLWSFIVDTGQQNSLGLQQNPVVLKRTTVVMKLIEPILNKGYRLFMDDWYNSPLLARFLKRNGTDCVGTLRSSHRDVPALIDHAPLKEGQFVARHSGDVCVLSCQDKKRFTMISTCHGWGTALPTEQSKPNSTRPLRFKPQAVMVDFCKYKGGVNLKDQMLEPYLIERKHCVKWYMKFFKHLLNTSILNARILLQSSTASSHLDHLTFRLQLVNSILEHHLSNCPQTRRLAASTSGTVPFRILQHSHWLVRIEQTSYDMATNRQSRQKCHVCLREWRKNKKTRYKCEACNVPLCVEHCYKTYHTT